MNPTFYPIDSETLLLDTEAAKTAGASMAQSYQTAAPYPHICIDNFLPANILEKVRHDVDAMPVADASFARAQENLKTAYNPDRLPALSRHLFQSLNSRHFLLFLEEMTGIKGLIPDPYFIGAGIHRVGNGGHLDIHADFNLHKPMMLERRLNVLIYLNPNWQAEWGGSFEIWDKEMKGKVKSFAPIFNRMVCFSTASDTFHGNPEIVNHPAGDPRLSIALYYYTATWGPHRKAHSTLFKPRPGTLDEVDRLMARTAFIENILPPFLYRRVGRRLARLGLR